MYPYLNDNEILEITNDYQEYKNLVQATETFTDFPIIYEDSNISKFLTKDDIEELKIAIEEMTIFVESLEEQSLKNLKYQIHEIKDEVVSANLTSKLNALRNLVADEMER